MNLKTVLTVILFICLFPLSLLFIPFLLSYSAYSSAQKSNTNLFDEKNGIFTHELKYKEESYSLSVNTHKKTVTIKDQEGEETIPFSDIKKWGYHIGAIIVYPGYSGNHMNTKQGKLAWRNNHFYIEVDNIRKPKRKIKFFSQNGRAKLHTQDFWDDVENQYEQWMAIFKKYVK